jgi:hypothetical protein
VECQAQHGQEVISAHYAAQTAAGHVVAGVHANTDVARGRTWKQIAGESSIINKTTGGQSGR